MQSLPSPEFIFQFADWSFTARLSWPNDLVKSFTLNGQAAKSALRPKNVLSISLNTGAVGGNVSARSRVSRVSIWKNLWAIVDDSLMHPAIRAALNLASREDQ